MSNYNLSSFGDYDDLNNTPMTEYTKSTISQIDKEIILDNNRNKRIELDENNSFGNNDKKILNLFKDNESSYSFNGMTKKLNMHQQSLSRALKRLEYLGIIEKTLAGYKLNKVEPSHSSVIIRQNLLIEDDLSTIAHLSIPKNINIDIILNGLQGKWLDTLRWIGIKEKKEEKILTWIFHGNILSNFEINMHIDYKMRSIDIKTDTKNNEEKIHSIILASKLINLIGTILNLNLPNAMNHKINNIIKN